MDKALCLPIEEEILKMEEIINPYDKNVQKNGDRDKNDEANVAFSTIVVSVQESFTSGKK